MKYRIWHASGQLAETNILFVERRKGPRDLVGRVSRAWPAPSGAGSSFPEADRAQASDQEGMGVVERVGGAALRDSGSAVPMSGFDRWPLAAKLPLYRSSTASGARGSFRST